MQHDSEFPLSRFHEHGICILRQSIAPEQLHILREQAQELRRWAEEQRPPGLRWVSPQGWPDAKEEGDSGATWGLNEITRQSCFRPQIINALAQGSLGEAVEELVEEPRAWGLKVLWAPRSRRYDLHWHRDMPWAAESLLPYKPPRQDHVQYNVALEQDQAFEVIPGSHRRRLLPAERQAVENDRHAPVPGGVPIHLEPGDTLVMDAHALHRGQASAGAPRLSLHYSVQAQWVPLLPWGDPEHFAWICSDAFRAQLEPRTALWYQRLNSAQRCDSQLAWLKDEARRQGWDGSSDPLFTAWDERKRQRRKQGADY